MASSSQVQASVDFSDYKVKNTFIHYDSSDISESEDEDSPALCVGKTKSNVLDGVPTDSMTLENWTGDERRPTLLQPRWPAMRAKAIKHRSKDVATAEPSAVSDYKVKNTFIHYDSVGLDDDDEVTATWPMVCKCKSNILDGTPMTADTDEMAYRMLSDRTTSVDGEGDWMVATETAEAFEDRTPGGLNTHSAPSVNDLDSNLPSVGSAGHELGDCKPCAWYWKRAGCVNGRECRHCHSCDSNALKRRKKARAERLRESGLV